MRYKSIQGAWFLAPLSVVHLCRRLVPAHEFSRSNCAKCEKRLNQPCIAVKNVRCHVCKGVSKEKTVIWGGLVALWIVFAFVLR